MQRGLLFAGTDSSVYVSFDDGASWQPLALNLPTAWVGDLAVHGNDLVAATQGRALWVLDDVSPLRQLAHDAAVEPARLFAPADAIRVRANESRDTPLPPEVPIAHNPPAGAVIDYVVGAGTRGPVTLEILDARGSVVRTFSSDAPPPKVEARRYFTDNWIRPPEVPGTSPGHHRFVWDLRYARPEAADYEFMIAAIDGEDTPTEPRGPLVAPGRYTVRLTAGGKRFEQPLTVRPDPRISVPESVYADKLAMQQRIAAAMGSSFQTLEGLRAYRMAHPAPTPTPASGGGTAHAGPRDPVAVLEADLARSNRTLSAILNQLDAADAPATAAQTAALKETLEALETQQARWKTMSSGK
jgi:hypothetical protein